MNTNLLKIARRFRSGTRIWTVPGYGNGARLTPSSLSFNGWGASFQWPCHDPRDGSEMLRSVDLNRHRQIARQAARALLDSLKQEA